MSRADVEVFAKTALSRRHKELSQTQLKEVPTALGLDTSGHMNTEARKDQFVKGIRTL